MNCDSRTEDTLDGKTVILNQLPSGDIELIIAAHTRSLLHGFIVEHQRGTKLLAKCVLTPAQFGKLVMPSILVRP